MQLCDCHRYERHHHHPCGRYFVWNHQTSGGMCLQPTWRKVGELAVDLVEMAVETGWCTGAAGVVLEEGWKA